MEQIVGAGLLRWLSWLKSAPADQRKTRLKNAVDFFVFDEDRLLIEPCSWVITAGVTDDIASTTSSKLGRIEKFSHELLAKGWTKLEDGHANYERLSTKLSERMDIAQTALSRRSDPDWKPRKFWLPPRG